MPNSEEAMRIIREMINDDDLLARFDCAAKTFDMRDKRISRTLDELLKEVDELLQRIDDVEE